MNEDDNKDSKYQEVEKVIGHSLGAKLTILLDENLFQLKPSLKAAGFKVIQIEKGKTDDEIKELAENTAVLTKNSKHFLEDAVAFDYDVISIELIKFIDPLPDRTNQTTKKIAKSIRDSGFARQRGVFNLKIHDDGSYELISLI